jgi:putative transposase
MKLEASVAELVQAFKEIQEIKDQPGKILEMVKTEVPKVIGDYLSQVMQVELTRFLGRQPYERKEEGESDHRNGSYSRSLTLKKIGEVAVKVPRIARVGIRPRLFRKVNSMRMSSGRILP